MVGWQIAMIVSLIGAIGCVARAPSLKSPSSHAVDSSVVSSLPISSTGHISWPTATRFDDGWVVAANFFPFGLNAQVRHRALYLAHSRTGLLPLPDGDFLFAYPLVRSTPDGALHLFWSEGLASSHPQGWPYTFTALWHATFVRGRWTTPERVIQGKWLEWNSRGPQVVTDDSGRFHLVVTATDSGRPGETYHLMRDAAGWHRQGTGLHVSYSTLASLPGGRLVMVYVMGEQGSGATNQLYSRSSSDYGRTWAAPVRVLPVSDTAAVHLTQLRVVRDSLYLGWVGAQTKEGNVWNLIRRRVTRDDLPDAWTVPVRSAPLPGMLLDLTFAVNGCGDIRAVAHLLTPSMQPVVRELHVRDDRVVVEQPFGDAVAFAALIDRSGDRIVQLWSGVRAPNDSVQASFRELLTCR